MAAADIRQDQLPARVLDDLLPLMARTRAQQDRSQSPRREAVDGDDGLEAEYVLCEFDGVEHVNFHGSILVQARSMATQTSAAGTCIVAHACLSALPQPQDLDTSAPRVTLDGQSFSSVQSNNVSARCRCLPGHSRRMHARGN
jgi:hypothetical protein